jgi:hypothetical protein
MFTEIANEIAAWNPCWHFQYLTIGVWISNVQLDPKVVAMKVGWPYGVLNCRKI